MFRNRSLILIKYTALCVMLLFMAILAFSILKKSGRRVKQKEETITLDITGKVNICLPEEADAKQ